MSNTQKTPAARAAKKVEVKGVAFTITDDKVTAALPNRKKITLSLVLDLEELFELMEGVSGINDDADVMETMIAIRKLVPQSFLTDVKGIDATLSLTIFMQWVQILGERLGKAIT